MSLSASVSVERIQTLVDALATRLGRAVVVDDHELRPVSVSKDFGGTDPAGGWSWPHRGTRPEDVRYEEIKQWTGPGYVPANAALELWRRLCVPIRCQGVLLGFVWITDRPADLTPAQVADAARTAEALGPALYGVSLHGGPVAVAPGPEPDRRLVEQLTGTDPAARRAAWEEALDRGLLDDVRQLAVVLVECRPGEGGGSPADPRSALTEAVDRLCRTAPGETALAAVRPGRATVVLGRRQGFGNGRLSEAVTALLAGLTDRSGVAGCWRIGAGGPARGLDGLPRARRQAEIALSAAGGTDGPGGACWPELGADALLAQLAPQAWENALLPDGVAALLADPSAAVLVRTLETYLDCAGDERRTARELCVRRTTLAQRLARAEQISGLSLRDGRDRLLLHLALGLRRLHGSGTYRVPVPHRLSGLPADAATPAGGPGRRAG